MNIFEIYRSHVLSAVEAVVPPGLSTAAITLELPRDPSHGDLSTNAAMVLAGQAGERPRDMAMKIAERLQAAPDVAAVEVAGPGFINLRLKPAAWQAQLLKGDRTATLACATASFVRCQESGDSDWQASGRKTAVTAAAADAAEVTSVAATDERQSDRRKRQQKRLTRLSA